MYVKYIFRGKKIIYTAVVIDRFHTQKGRERVSCHKEHFFFCLSYSHEKKSDVGINIIKGPYFVYIFSSFFVVLFFCAIKYIRAH